MDVTNCDEKIYTGINECKSVCFGIDDTVVDFWTFGVSYCDYTSNYCAFGYFCDMHPPYPECNYCPTYSETSCEYFYEGIDECKRVCFGIDDTVVDDVVVDNSGGFGTFGDYCDTSNDCAFGYFCDMYPGDPFCLYCPPNNETSCEYYQYTDGIDECKSVCFGKKLISKYRYRGG